MCACWLGSGSLPSILSNMSIRRGVTGGPWWWCSPREPLSDRWTVGQMATVHFKEGKIYNALQAGFMEHCKVHPQGYFKCLLAVFSTKRFCSPRFSDQKSLPFMLISHGAIDSRLMGSAQAGCLWNCSAHSSKKFCNKFMNGSILGQWIRSYQLYAHNSRSSFHLRAY